MTAVSKRMKVEQARNGGHGAEMNNGGNKQCLSFEKVEAEIGMPGLQFEKHFLHIQVYL